MSDGYCPEDGCKHMWEVHPKVAGDRCNGWANKGHNCQCQRMNYRPGQPIGEAAGMSEPGYVIWKAWRDGMLAQGRYVTHERMSWDTLPERDKALDAAIEAEAALPSVQALAKALVASNIIDRLQGYFYEHRPDATWEDPMDVANGWAFAILAALRVQR